MTMLSSRPGTRAVGAIFIPDGPCSFRVWAPHAKSIDLFDCEKRGKTPLTCDDGGYWSCEKEGVGHGFRYRYLIDGEKERPDPASFWQPDGVHGPSAVVDHSLFSWNDAAWKGIPLENMIFYELHIGTFTKPGTFDSAIERLDHLVELGITTVEIMPVAQFPGSRNWGYDGVFPFAVHNTYGGPLGLKRLVDACHGRGLAVALDVVYNHLGPEGNCIWEFGPYFTRDKYRTPWGWAVNYDDSGSDGVREYFIANALYWFERFHIDVLRIDAVHAIIDLSAKHILQELAERVGEYNRLSRFPRLLIAESDLNDSRLIRPHAFGGYGLDAQWSDDFHHALHTVLTGEQNGYYGDFGDPAHLARAINEGYAYSGVFSLFRNRRHGNSAADLPPGRFVVFSQNHDQVGNRMLGERLSALVDFESLKCAAAAVILAPQVPLLFMGEEWGEASPFLYFVSHGDPRLVESVRKGRKEEFKDFHGAAEAPDPQDEATFLRSTIDWVHNGQKNAFLLRWYRRLIELRKAMGGACISRQGFTAKMETETRCLSLYRSDGARQRAVFINFTKEASQCRIDKRDDQWLKILDSSDAVWGGPGVIAPATASSSKKINIAGRSIVVYEYFISADMERRQ